MTAFETFFSNSFHKMLDNVPDEHVYSCPTRSIRGSSWDRKAAFIVWDLLGRPGSPGNDSGVAMAPFQGGDENEVRYWYHPESDSLFTTEPGEHPASDGLVEEIDYTSYTEIKLHHDHWARFAMAPFEGGEDTFEI